MNATPEQSFVLAPEFEEDSKFIMRLGLSQLRLMNDARFPWLLLIPEINGLEEWIDLQGDHLRQMTVEIEWASRALLSLSAPNKLNVASLGNIVRQLHIHVVARKIGDAAWPGPVWGAGSAVPYPEETLNELCGQIRELVSQIAQSRS